MSNTIATYLCTGCGIGEAVDMEVMNEAASEVSAEIKTSEALCQEAGRAMIQADIDGGVNSVAICACSMSENMLASAPSHSRTKTLISTSSPLCCF